MIHHEEPFSRNRFNMLLILGAFVMFFPSGVFLYWGNVSVYVNSYIVNNTMGLNKKFPGPWIISTFFVCNNLGITCGRPLNNRIGRRQTAIVAVFLFNSGLFLASIAIPNSLTATCASFGLLTGLGSGLLYSSVIADVIDCSEENVGFLTQTVTMGYNVGAVVTNQYVTFYINPDNVDVDTQIDSVSYFSTEDILQAVPPMFRILAVFTTVIQVMGLMMIQVHFCKNGNKWEREGEASEELLQHNDDYKNVSGHEWENSSSSEYNKYDYQNKNEGQNLEKRFVPRNTFISPREARDYVKVNKCLEVSERRSESVFDSTHSTTMCINSGHNIEACNGNEESGDIANLTFTTDNGTLNKFVVNDKDIVKIHKPCKSESNKKVAQLQLLMNENSTPDSKRDLVKILNQTEVTPRRLFCFKAAYVILAVILAKHIAFNLLSNYYKTLGENYIHDDQFLAILGSLLSLISIPVKPAIGLALDKCGTRTPTILSLITLCINSAVYPITPRINKWMFLVSSLLFEASICAMNACCSLLTLLILGREYFTTNYGLLASVTILLDILFPVVIQTVLVGYGWVALFSGASIAIFMSLVMSVMFLPPK